MCCPARDPHFFRCTLPLHLAHAARHTPRSFFQDLMSDLASAMTSSSELCFRRALTDMPMRVDCKAGSLGWGSGRSSAQTLRAGRERAPAGGGECPSPGLLPHVGLRSLAEGQAGSPQMALPISSSRKRQGQSPRGGYVPPKNRAGARKPCKVARSCPPRQGTLRALPAAGAV